MSAYFSAICVFLSRVVTESEHVVDAAVSTIDGVELAFGDVERMVIARSALKPIQVLPLVHSGAAAAFGFSPQDIALGSASHSAEVMHLERTAEILERLGLDESALECGPARPLAPEQPPEQADRILRAGESFRPIHNCCSGKHAGFLAICRHLGVDPEGYIEPGHPVQQLVTEAIATFTGFDVSTQPSGVDGCGIPTHAVPLRLLALSMARLVRASEVPEIDASMANAAEQVVDALSLNPRWMSGAGRAEVVFGEQALEPLLCKIGAEGVFTAALPERGIGIALKSRDGARRAADVAMQAILSHLGVLTETDAVHTVVNAAGTVVGTMQASWS